MGPGESQCPLHTLSPVSSITLSPDHDEARFVDSIRAHLHLTVTGNHWASQAALVVKNLPADAGNIRDGFDSPGLRRSPGGGHGHPLQYSCLENPHGQRSLEGYSP